MNRAIYVWSAVIGLLAGGLMFAAPVSADVGCSEYKACVARGTGGAASPYAYQFAVADSNLSNNYYDNEQWPFKGPQVNDNVRSVRNRNSAWSSACVYYNTSWSGLIGGAEYYNEGWVAVAQGASSIAMWQEFVC